MEDVAVLFGPSSLVNVKVHPAVIFNILDHFIRRNEGEDRVIGTLLGTNIDGAVEIRNCFPVPHTEADQVAVDMEFHKTMYELHQKTSPKEVIVGWYATSLDVNENSVMIHEFFGKEMTGVPVHLLVDTALTHDTLGIRAYTGTSLTFGEKQLGSYFQPVPLEIQTLDVDRVGLDVISRTINNKEGGDTTLIADLDNLEISIGKLLEMINTVTDYVTGVVNGTIEGDKAIGRFIQKSLSVLPKMDSETMDKVLNGSLQDLLMVVYLANLTRTQIALAQKLQQSLP